MFTILWHPARSFQEFMMKKIEDYLLIKEAAELLGVKPATLRNWERHGKLISHRHPMNHYRLYKKEDLEALLKKLYESQERPYERN